MFHSAALKLTLWYLAIIVALSITLSLIIYNLSRNEIINTDRRQNFFLNDRLPTRNFNSYNILRNQDVEEALKRLRGNLVLFNLMIFIVGGAASYALARRTLEPIEQSLESQKRFTGDASHELRTPLTVMQTENEVALRNPTLTKKDAIKQLKSNLEEVAKLKKLSDGLLRLASFDSALSLDNSVKIKPVIKEAVERWRKIALSKKINIKLDVDDLAVKGDRDSLIELMSVLIDNAIKYSSARSTITVSAHKKNKGVQINVSDSGQGIDARDLPKIFERFYQTESSRSAQQGYGLGLSIAKRIVEVHRGTLGVSSAPGKGSTFSVQLLGA